MIGAARARLTLRRIIRGAGLTLVCTSAAVVPASAAVSSGVIPFEGQARVGHVDSLVVPVSANRVFVLGHKGSSTRQALWVMNPDGSGLRLLVPQSTGVNQVAVNPSGTFVLAELYGGRRFHWINLKTGTTTTLSASQATSPMELGTDGSVYVSSGDPATTYRLKQLLPGGGSRAVHFEPSSFSQDAPGPARTLSGDGIAFCSFKRELRVGSTTSGGVLATRQLGVSGSEWSGYSCGASQDGRTIYAVADLTPSASTTHRMATFLWARGFPVRRWPGAPKGDLHISPDGRYAVFYDIENLCGQTSSPATSSRRIEIYDAHTGGRRSITVKGGRLAEYCSEPVFSTDSRMIAVGTLRPDTIEIVTLATGAVRLVRAPTNGQPEPLVFAPGGRLVFEVGTVGPNGLPNAAGGDWFSVRSDGTGLLRISSDSFVPAVLLGALADNHNIWFAKSWAWVTDIDGDLYSTDTAGFAETPLSH